MGGNFMKNKFKKLTIGMLSAAVVAGATATLTGCGGGDDPDKLQVMNLSVNPGIEFIVDEEDKVVSVTADNEDGAYILDKFTEFTGMSAKDAALKFLELSEQYGFVVSGSTNGEKITISVSGEGAEELYNDVKSKVSAKVSELGMQVAKMVEIGEDELEEIIAECYQEFSEEEIDDLSEERMLELLKKSREETEGLYTEDERLAYYKDRAQKVIEAKITAIKEYISESVPAATQAIVQPVVLVLDAAYTQIQSAYTTINNTLETLNTNINSKLSTYIAEKEEYLAAVEAYRAAVEDGAANVDALKQEMERLRGEAKTLQSELATARDNARAQIMTAVKNTVHTGLTNINNKINEILGQISMSATALETAVNNEIAALKTAYQNNTENPWTVEE